MRNYKIIVTSVVAGVLSLGLSVTASAHVIVQPTEVQTAAAQIFTVSVPSERDAATVKVELTVPGGLDDISPITHPGWTITETKDKDTVSSVTWEGGSIPSGQRDLFSLSAKAPASASTLDWKAYQTYEDGTVVSWSQKPSAKEADDDSATTGPFSVTNVVAQTAASAQATKTQQTAADAKKAATRAQTAGIIGIALGVTAIGIASRKQK